MNEAYDRWIQAYVARYNGFVRGKCQPATLEMQAAFPELRIAAGFAHVSWGRDQHFWCVAPDGSVVDPTAAQFQLPIHYEELDLNDPKTRELVPIGKCMNCGEETYVASLSADMCSQKCADDFVAYLQKERNP